MMVGAGFPGSPGSPLGPGGPGIGTGTSARSGRFSTAFVGSGATGVPPLAFTCSRSARTSPASVDTAVPRRSASLVSSSARRSPASMRCQMRIPNPVRASSAQAIHMRWRRRTNARSARVTACPRGIAPSA
ncbi:hypothetical protein B1C81_10995 [Streptomyces sp. HG99]|nr:hypothetical protein B1C81_10995 [Streptomyces sp. HG99]